MGTQVTVGQARDANGRTISEISVLTKRLDYDGGSQPIYVGWAAPGSATSAAVWHIEKYTYDGTQITAIQHAMGKPEFNKVWDDRASLAFS